MSITDFLPFWEELDEEDRILLKQHAQRLPVASGTAFRETADEPAGIMLIEKGLLRIYMLSAAGQEMTLYRLQAGEVCILPAAFLLPDLPFDIVAETERETILWSLPARIFAQLAEHSLPVARWNSRLLSDRLLTMTACISQLLWKHLDSRLAGFLLEESRIEQTSSLRITHERLAGHLGTAREVISRILQHFQREGLVRLTRGTVEILDSEGLRRLSLL